MRRKPYSVVLFDEIEKAHEDVWNILLQILEDGVVTDAQGRKVDFRNTAVIMTSNIGAKSITAAGTPLGFAPEEQKSANAQFAAVKAAVIAELRRTFRPEFLNRVDEIISFNHLSEENFRAIAKIMLGELAASLKEKGITFTYEESLVELLTEKSYSRTYGARNLRRTIQKELEDPMATRIIDSYEHPITQIRASAENGQIRLDTL